MQLDATVGYAGLFANVWWNIGAGDWTFSSLKPEMDVAIGFSRWGLSVYYLHCFYFDHYADGTMSHFFDFRNNTQGGTTAEWRVIYNRPVYTNKRGWTTSVNGLCAVRTFSRDGYYAEARGEEASRLEGEKEWKRAYSRLRRTDLYGVTLLLTDSIASFFSVVTEPPYLWSSTVA